MSSQSMSTTALTLLLRNFMTEGYLAPISRYPVGTRTERVVQTDCLDLKWVILSICDNVLSQAHFNNILSHYFQWGHIIVNIRHINHGRKSASGFYSSGGNGPFHWTILEHLPRWIETTHRFTPVTSTTTTLVFMLCSNLRVITSSTNLQISCGNSYWKGLSRLTASTVHMMMKSRLKSSCFIAPLLSNDDIVQYETESSRQC